MRILIIGANGMLGKDLVREWTLDEIISATSREADIRDFQQVRQLVTRTHPDWVVLTAAYTDVDGSEKNPEQAFAVNGEGTRNVALAAQDEGARLFYVSTDYLFDGTATHPIEPDHPIAPLNVYGQSKAAGEKSVQDRHQAWCIARTSWLFGASGASFPEKILRASETRPELTVVADQFGSPTFTRDLSSAIRDLVHTDARGILNVTNTGSCSWFDFAREVLHQAGRDSIRVLPITTADAGRPAKRPAYSVLSPASLNSRGFVLRSWQDATTAYLKDLRSVGKLT
ncbi:MAG TPA: dTDP-4-dehydrorhamnose reductase [Candidatus Acidoferrum sp.]